MRRTTVRLGLATIQAVSALTQPIVTHHYRSHFGGTGTRLSRQQQRTLLSRRHSSLVLTVPSVEDMEDVGGLIASLVLEQSQPQGLVLLLEGDLGAGKTAFARGFVRGATGDWDLRVTSPTYLLSNTYQAQCRRGEETDVDNLIEIHHMDLYRLTAQDLKPLQLDHVFQNCISLIEWPVRLISSPVVPSSDAVLQVDIRIVSEEGNMVPRRLTLSCEPGPWTACLDEIRREGLLDDMLFVE